MKSVSYPSRLSCPTDRMQRDTSETWNRIFSGLPSKVRRVQSSAVSHDGAGLRPHWSKRSVGVPRSRAGVNESPRIDLQHAWDDEIYIIVVNVGN
eukprot:16406130-Heterocapsa_arctica.AAC.1